MKKINIAELLKDCPQGMELDCTICNNVVTLEGVDTVGSYPIRVVSKSGFHHILTCEGYVYADEDAKCVIFPKGKTTWEGFVPPVDFKNGDVIAVENACGVHIFIYNNTTDEYGGYGYYVIFTSRDRFKINGVCSGRIYRLATKEEKRKLFQAIKDNGYCWNSETKILERLPKFKVGDRVKSKTNKYRYTIGDIRKDCYIMYYENDKFGYLVPFCNENEFDLIPNKFDITTLKPFESSVLVRDNDFDNWKPSFWGYLRKGEFMYDTVRGVFRQCIPYEGNEHLLSKTDDCDDFYKTWEK